MSNNKSKVEYPSDREIVFTRVFDAPPELVWKAWTDPRLVAEWWGPKGFTNTIHEMDVRPGGIWRLTMHGPDGTNYPNRIEFLEVVKPGRLVYIHGDDNNHHMFHVTTNFTAEGARTKLVSRMLFKTAAECAETKKFAVDGINATMDRLDGQLAKMGSVAKGAAEEFIISRVFDAPRELVWKACTEPERLKQWFGPKGFAGRVAKMDFRPGGMYHYCLTAPDGAEMWGRFVYREIVPPERIVFINSFSDPTGAVARHPMHLAWPLEMLSTFLFVEHEGKTTFTIRSTSYNATEAERATFNAGRDSMRQGWTGTLDQLAEYLKQK